MAAQTITTDWVALARSLWRAAQITGDGPHAVVVRCGFPFTEVHLFQDFKAARDFEAGFCCPTCYRKHTWGDLRPHIPAPPPPVKSFRWTPEMQRD
jgi:hypothetical protein